jgi:uncharacterized repeat protein (TIGR01451 family)
MRRSAGTAVASLAASVVLVALTVGIAPAQTAAAVFADQCAAPTRTVAPTGASISVAAGETVLLSGGQFTGGVDALPAGATLCVASGSTLSPGYMNNAAGALVVAAGGTLAMPNVAVGAGFTLDVEGTAVFAGLNINGSAAFTIAAGGDMTISSSFSPGAGTITNAGTLHIASSMNLNTSVTLSNSGELMVDQASSLNGPFTNTGTARFGGTLTINGSGSLQNGCAMSVAGDLNNNGSASANGGILLVTGGFSNNGSWSQSPSGSLGATTLTDDGHVTGFGQYRFTGNTSVQGSFVGDSASAPITADTTAPAGQIFTVQTGTVSNVVRGIVTESTLESFPAPDCGTPRPSADVLVSKSGPATATQGSAVTYTVTVGNGGPGAADAVTVTDALPAGLSGVTASNGGVVSATTVIWTVGTLAVNQVASLTVSGTVTAAAGTTLLDVASSASSTPDPDPENNDGSSESSQAETLVVAAVPPNQPPIATAQTLTATTGTIALGRATATDPDSDQELRYSLVTRPIHGVMGLLPGGGFAYRSASDFSGVDTAEFMVCDNGTPVLCSSATITFNVLPIATDSAAQTFEAQPVVIPIVPNSVSAGSQLSDTLVTPPAHGSITFDLATGEATYTPVAGFTGTDGFEFQTCSPTAPTLCDTGTVTVTVVPVNRPPLINDVLVQTTTDTPVSHQFDISDPDGNVTRASAGSPPRSGGVAVQPDGTVVYTPVPGYAGRDSFSTIVCDDGDPELCASGTAVVEVSPIATADSVTGSAGDPVTVDILANDLGTVDAPTIVTPPAHGTLAPSGTSFVYSPNAGFAGIDSFEYQICATNAADLCATATATVTVDAVVAPVPPNPPTPPTPGDPDGSLAFTGVNAEGPLLWAAGALVLGLVIVGVSAFVRRGRRRQ